jgi:hypothetical protein
MTSRQRTLFDRDDVSTGSEVELRTVMRFPAYKNISNGDLFSLSLSNNTSALTHGMHRFAAKFIPQIPAWAIEEFAEKSSTVLDPFCGSGTTLVEALHRCKSGIGIDCDPLACLIAGSKTASVSPKRIRSLAVALERAWAEPATELTDPMPGIRDFGHWFSKDAWGWLQSLRDCVLALEASETERRVFLTVFSSIVRWVSNADDQTQKTYVSGTLKKSPPAVVPVFWKALRKAETALGQLQEWRLRDAEAKVMCGDAANIDVKPESIDLVVTSPPYLDSVDYMYNFMLEYFWLGPLLGVKDKTQFNGMRRGVIGAKNPASREVPVLPGSSADLIAEEDIAPARLLATRMYCHMMGRHFASAARAMKPEARYVLVVGNSQSHAGALPIHDMLIRLAADAGLKFERAFAYRVRRHYMKFPRKGRGGIILMDWVIVLRRASRPQEYPPRLPIPNVRLGHDEVAH